MYTLFLLSDLITLWVVLFWSKNEELFNLTILGYLTLFWVASSYLTEYYVEYRSMFFSKTLRHLLLQFLLLAFGYFAYFSIFKEGTVVENKVEVLNGFILALGSFKFSRNYLLRTYRTFGKNYRKIVVLGMDNSTKKLINFFKSQQELGYRYYGFFSDKVNHSKEYIGAVGECFPYILKEGIDEIYCSLNELSEQDIRRVKKFGAENNREVKLIPSANGLYNKNTIPVYYGNASMVLKVRKMPFEFIGNRIIKRIFDVLFSLFVCVFILSWLYPILFVLIKLESKGPVIFKQVREGFLGEHFICYKFRSMHTEKDSCLQENEPTTSKVTKIGAFMRRTSMDELPQFINVLQGFMSVVGPRPHMEVQSDKFTKEVSNYMKRKCVKPGITGLAQTSGYRGEIKKKSDIENRVRLDIFYIGNWCLGLDIKIIIKTIINILKGEEKAY